MGTVTDRFALAFRDNVTDGVASSGSYEPLKSDIRAIGPALEDAIANIGIAGMLDATFSTRAALVADLTYADGSVALVYADATDSYNDLYVKNGAAGAGAWAQTTILHDVLDGLVVEDRVAAEAAAADAATARDDAQTAQVAAELARDDAQDVLTEAGTVRDIVIATDTDYADLADANANAPEGSFFSYRDAGGLPVYATKTGGVVTPIVGPWFGDDKISRTGGGTAKDLLDLVQPIVDGDTRLFRSAAGELGLEFNAVQKAWWNATGLSLGDVGGASRLTLLTGPADAMDNFNSYNKAGQGVSTAFRSAVWHHYNDADLEQKDLVGDGRMHEWTFARNPAARADKPSTYVGGGDLLRVRASTPTGTGGSAGDGTDLMFDWMRSGQMVWYGVGQADSDGAFASSAIQLRPSNAAARALTFAYVPATGGPGRGVIGVLNDGVEYEFLDMGAQAWRPISANFTAIGAASLDLKDMYIRNAVTVTSDARFKTPRGPLTEQERRVALRVGALIQVYQLNDSIEKKKGTGEDAREHIGVFAQEVWAEFANEGLVDPIGDDGKPTGRRNPYAFLCFEEWDDELVPDIEEVTVKRNVVWDKPTGIRHPRTNQMLTRKHTEKNVPVLERRQKVDPETGEKLFKLDLDGEGRERRGGFKYMVRYEELEAFVISALVWQVNKQAQAITSIEARLTALGAVAK